MPPAAGEPGRWQRAASFSIVIAGLGVRAELDAKLGALSAAYVLLLAVLGPVLARIVAVRFPPTAEH